VSSAVNSALRIIDEQAAPIPTSSLSEYRAEAFSVIESVINPEGRRNWGFQMTIEQAIEAAKDCVDEYVWLKLIERTKAV
jgi:hypothetical protein